MSYINGITIRDSANLDAFGRLRMSEAVTLFDSLQTYGDSALVWENSTSGTGGVSNIYNSSGVQMSTGGTLSGASVIRQTRAFWRYQPGKSLQMFTTFLLPTAATNLTSRVGYFDTQNGIYLEIAGTTVNVVKRTYTSGSPVNSAIAQASWNIDPMNGTGPSGLTLDLTKVQILVIDLQWLGTGRVRIGFDINGQVYYVHQFLCANLLTVPYMTNACLPVRLELTNTGATSGTNTLLHICSTVVSEAGVADALGLQFTANNGTSSVSAGATLIPILSIRASTTGPNSQTNRGQIIPVNFEVNNGSTATVLYELILNGTLTSPSFAKVNSTYSLTESDTTASAISGGTVLASGYCGGGSKITQATNLVGKQNLVYTELGSVQDTLSICATAVSSSSNLLCAINWQEEY